MSDRGILLVDRLGFERVVTGAVCKTWIVPRRFVSGQSKFRLHGPVYREGMELIEYREEDDMTEELKNVHETVRYLRSEIRRLEGTIGNLNEENGALALELRRTAPNESEGEP